MTVLSDKIADTLLNSRPLSLKAITVIVKEYIKPESAWRHANRIKNQRNLQGFLIDRGYAKIVGWTLGSMKNRGQVELVTDGKEHLWRVPKKAPESQQPREATRAQDWTCRVCKRKFTTYEEQPGLIMFRLCPYCEPSRAIKIEDGADGS